MAPANYATLDSTRAGRRRWGCKLHPAGHPTRSQSSVARLGPLGACARQLCYPGQHSGCRRCCQPHTAGHPSQSSVAKLGARARQLCDPGQQPGRGEPLTPGAHGRRAIRVSRQWRGWGLAPAKYATLDSTLAGSGRVVSGEVGSTPPIMRPGTAPGRAAAAGVASCTRRAIRVSLHLEPWYT